ncbi:hypothetical protein WA026_003055 [Henosepilachna vigintioctopunctata]|uniref:3-hydroxyisobutyrate dehydrogenase n=1 Tax=Henosepilachna vigintioctopunctata TaxID=420089 RepID=A0AAW1TIW4_9CUCU
MFKSALKLIQCSLETELARRNASTVGFIGIGNMGTHMASHLAKKIDKVKVFDISAEAARSVKGAHVCSSLEETASNVDVLFLSLPNGDIVKDTLVNKGVMKALPKKSLIVDTSTIDPKVSKELFRLAEENSLRFLDSPVSGGVTGAEAATLAIMVGGNKTDFDSIKPILHYMGARVVYCGSSGSGLIAKIANNLILGISMIGVSEGMNLGIKAGLDPKVLHDVINSSTGRCWSSDTYSPVPNIFPNVPSNNDYKGGYNIKLVVKDLALAETTAVNCEVPVPLGATAHQIYRALISNGYGDKDIAAVYKFLKGAD